MQQNSNPSIARKQVSAVARAAAQAPATALWAITYANAGLHPLRLAPVEHGESGTGKRPIGKGWQKRQLDVEALCAALYRHPRSNLGLRMGMQPDGRAIVALDVDDPAAAAKLFERLGTPPETMRTVTGRGGHLFYRVPADVLPRLRNFLRRDGIDLRAEGGQVAAGPSLHFSGARYRTTLAPIARLPRVWMDWLTPAERSEASAHELPAEHSRELDLEALTPHLAPAGVPDGRHELARALGGWAARQGYADDAIARAVRALPSDCPHERAAQAVDAAQRARSGEAAPGWGVLEARFSADVLDQLQRDNADAHVELTKAILARRTARAANDTHGAEQDASPAEQGRDPAVDGIIAALSPPTVGVFQRGGRLCTVTRDARADGDVVRPSGAPTIRDLPPARLREIVRMTVGPSLERLSGEVAARGEWDHIRPLDAIVSYPIMRRDGTLLLSSGYDSDTRTLASIDVRVDVPDRPTRDDAREALAELGKLVCDFPFASDAAKSAWLAMLLTVPARPAIAGPTPLGLLEAAQRGSGKTLLADVLSVIVTGSEAPRRVAPKTKEEWDKVMLATLAAGDPIVLIDNVTNMLVSDALDAVLTGTTYTGRWLGVSENRTVAVRTVFLASANNARLSTDLVRRSISCRLEGAVERPEARTGFRYPDLLAHVRANRSALLGAALTILRAYALAGRPRVKATPMGSYSAWCAVVRDALVWAGAADPAETQATLREDADVERDELRELLTAWHAALGSRAVTVRELLDRCVCGGDIEKRVALSDALRAVMPNGAEPTRHAIGNKLRTLRGQIADGLVLQPGGHDKHAKALKYRVRRV